MRAPPPALSRSSRSLGWTVAAASGVCLVPYLLAIDHYLFEDDFMVFYYFGRRPLWRFWEFFRGESLFFYRPLGNWLMAAVFRVAGLNAAPFNVLLVLLWAATTWLFWRLVRDWLPWTGSMPWTGSVARTGSVTRTGSMAPAGPLVAVGFYLAAGPATGHLFFWASTLPSAVACCLYLHGLRSWWHEMRRAAPRPGRLLAVGIMLAAANLTKESYLSWAVLFLWIVLGRHWARFRVGPTEAWGDVRSSGRASANAADGVGGARGCLGWAIAALALPLLAGVVAVVMSVRHAETLNPTVDRAYLVAAVHLWPWQIAQALSRVCLPVSDATGGWGRGPYFGLPLSGIVEFLVVKAPVIPVALLAAAIRRRSGVALFGLAWALLAMTPSGFTEIYMSARYLHAASFGMALAVGAVLGAPLATLWRRDVSQPIVPIRQTVARTAVAVAATAYLLLCVAKTDLLFQTLRSRLEIVRELASAFREEDVSRGAEGQIYIVDLADGVGGADGVGEGDGVGGAGLRNLGLEEFARLVLGRDNVSALTADSFEGLDAFGFYSKTYPIQIYLRYDGARFHAQATGESGRSAPGSSRPARRQPRNP